MTNYPRSNIFSIVNPFLLFFQAGFTLGNVVGMYLAQNYDVSLLRLKPIVFTASVDALFFSRFVVVF